MAITEKSKISNTEWGLVFGAYLLLDLIQFLLDVFFQIGIVVNRFLDIIAGGALVFYLWIRGELKADPDNLTKKAIGLVATFLGEEIPDVDALPLWSADIAYNWFLAKERNLKYEKENKVKIEEEKANELQVQQQNLLKLQEIRVKQSVMEQNRIEEEQERQQEMEQTAALQNAVNDEDDQSELAA